MMRRAVPQLFVRSMRLGSHNNYFTKRTTLSHLSTTVITKKNSFHSIVPTHQQQQQDFDFTTSFFTALEYKKNKNFKMAVTLLEPVLEFVSSVPAIENDRYASELFKAKVTDELCYSYWKLNLFDQCIQCCDRLLVQEPNFQKLNILDYYFNMTLDSVLFIKTKALFDKGEYEMAAKYLDFIAKERIGPRLLNRDDDSKDNNQLNRRAENIMLALDIQVEQGRICMMYENYERALLLFDDVLERRNNDARTCVLRGATKLWLNRESEGYEDIERGLSLSEGDPDIQCDAWIQDAKYQILVKQNSNLALQLVNRALELLPERVDALVERMALHLKQNDYERVVEDGTTILHLRPGSLIASAVHPFHSYALIRLKRFQEAIQLATGTLREEYVRATVDCLLENYESVIEYSPDESVSLYETQVMRLECYLRLGLFDRAKIFVKKRMRQPEPDDELEKVLDLLFNWVIDVMRSSSSSNNGILEEPLAVPDAIAELLQDQRQVVNSYDICVLLVAQGTYYTGHYSITIECTSFLLSKTHNAICELWAHELAAMAYRASGDMEKAQNHLQNAKAMKSQ